MHLDFFSGTFYSLRTQYKKQYGLLLTDQADYFFESLFIIGIQLLLCIMINIYNDKQIVLINSFLVNSVMFLTGLTLHFSTIATIRNGITMCKYVVYHSEEFENPSMPFLLGVLIIITNIFCANTNAFFTLKQSNPIDIITKFVTFRIFVHI